MSGRDTARRGIIASLIALLLPLTSVLISETPASAAACDDRSYAIVDQAAEAAVSTQWNPQCTDGAAQTWGGAVRDILCDDRAARVYFQIYDKQANGHEYLLATSPTWVAPNGCGSSASLPTWRAPSPGSTGWKFVMHLKACSVTCSSDTVRSREG